MAAGQIDAAHAWWREHRSAARHGIRDELARTLALVVHQPGIGARATNALLSGVRRILLPRVGYWLYYRVAADRIDVLAFRHTRLRG
jgi:plasmid stabilization system protein ParE